MSFATDAPSPATFLPVSPPRREVTSHGYSQYADHEDNASTINMMMTALIEKAMARVTAELGFDIWSRSLNDWEHSYAAIIPASLYYDESAAAHDFRRTLKDFIAAIFVTHYIYIDVEWRDSSRDEEYESAESIYEVDCCGSRSRSINIGPHLFFTCRMRCTGTRRNPLDVAPVADIWPEGVPYKWTVFKKSPDETTVNYAVVSGLPPAEDAPEIEKAVWQKAVDAALEQMEDAEDAECATAEADATAEAQ
jgi:hypothetical protein